MHGLCVSPPHRATNKNVISCCCHVVVQNPFEDLYGSPYQGTSRQNHLKMYIKHVKNYKYIREKGSEVFCRQSNSGK